ncbi:MAG TPA: MlaD family protein [Opitutaceae bacterium]|jgi:phospholipid/cholesterol/gamma-HCH transport system substrate-binding protein
MNTAQQTARVGLFFLLGVALVWVTFETLSDGKIFEERSHSLIAGFDDLRQLKTGDEVRLAGVKVGSVKLTRLAGRRAEAVLQVDPKVPIANDAVATIVMAGLIGGNYISISMGSSGAPPLADGAEIRTQDSPDLNSLIAQLGGLGKQLQDSLGSFSKSFSGEGGAGGIFQKLDKLITENSQKLNDTMTNLQDITGKINRGEGTLGKLVNDPKLHDELLATVEQIKAAAEEAKQFASNAEGIMDQIKSGKGTIGTLVYDQQSADDIRASIANIRSVSDKLAKGQGTLGKLINDDSLYNSAEVTIKKVDRTIDGLNDSGPITAVGIAVNALF